MGQPDNSHTVTPVGICGAMTVLACSCCHGDRQGAIACRHWARIFVCPAWTLKEPTVSRVVQPDSRQSLSAEVLVRKGSPVMGWILRTALSCPRVWKESAGLQYSEKGCCDRRGTATSRAPACRVLLAADMWPVYRRTRPWRL